MNTPRLARFVLLTLLCWDSRSCGLMAQEPRRGGARLVDTARAQSASDIAPALTPGGEAVAGASAILAPKMRGDEEFGEQAIITRRAQVEPWALALDAQYFFTDNVALVPDGAVDDFYLRTGVAAQYANRIAGDWFIDAGLASHFYLHEEHDFFFFFLTRAGAGITRRLGWLAGAFASVHYSWFRITDQDFGDAVFQDHIANVNLQKLWKITRGQQIVVGAGADFSLAPEPAEPGRHEYSAYVSYKLRLTEKLSVLTGYRGAYYDYYEADRQDWNHSLTIGWIYEISERVRAVLNVSGALNLSSASVFDYENILSGAGLSLHVEF